MNRSSPSVAQSVSDVSSALTPRADEVSRDIYELILRDIPQLRGDRRVLLVLDASVRENVTTLLDIFQNGTDLEKVHAPAAAEEHARRLAQHGVPLPALLRAYRIGSARFQDWCLQELGRLINDVSLLSATGLHLAEVTASYIDRISEEVVVAYETEKEDWLRNQSATRAARARALLRGEQVDVDSSEAILGYRLRQHHVGVVCWADKPPVGGGVLARLEAATAEVARLAGCEARPLFLPQDECSAWAWLPVGASRSIEVPAWTGTEPGPGPQAEVRFAFGTAAAGVTGFRRTHQQAIGAYSVALAAGNSAQLMTGFGEVAPLALMSGSIELIRGWVIEILGSLAYDDEQNARLRDTLGVFLQENGSFKGTGERLSLHKNTVQYRVHKAEEGLGGPVGDRRLNVELALLATKWLGAAVLVKPGEPLALVLTGDVSALSPRRLKECDELPLCEDLTPVFAG
jgi:DNA-binding PucR family transcriptional regulator